MEDFNPSNCEECGGPLERFSPAGLCATCLSRGVEGEAPRKRPPDPPDEAAPSLAEVTSHFPQLEILEEIGRGGMGIVYRARQVPLDRIVALKVLHPRLSRDPAFAERFTREARSLARVGHPGVVAVYDFGRSGDLYYLIMEHVDGESLRTRLAERPPDYDEALDTAAALCDALVYAHSRGVVHRDVKPENVLLSKEGAVKVADFGLARMLSEPRGGERLTGTRQILGTAGYMAPEQLEGRETDHRADLYAAGAVLYEMLTGERLLGQFDPAGALRVGEGLREVLRRALARDPEERFQSAAEMRRAIRSCRTERPPEAEDEETERLLLTLRNLTALGLVTFSVGAVLMAVIFTRFLEHLFLLPTLAFFAWSFQPLVLYWRAVTGRLKELGVEGRTGERIGGGIWAGIGTTALVWAAMGAFLAAARAAAEADGAALWPLLGAGAAGPAVWLVVRRRLLAGAGAGASRRLDRRAGAVVGLALVLVGGLLVARHPIVGVSVQLVGGLLYMGSWLLGEDRWTGGSADRAFPAALFLLGCVCWSLAVSVLVGGLIAREVIAVVIVGAATITATRALDDLKPVRVELVKPWDLLHPLFFPHWALVFATLSAILRSWWVAG